MKIEFVEIQNFKKLKSCRIDFSTKETVFVGANNSGKTSAMDAFFLFLKNRTGFTTRDFTLSHWKKINEIGKNWIAAEDASKVDLSIGVWGDYLPTLDVWLKVENNELHHVSHLIPTLKWKGDLLGVRLRLEPKNPEELFKEFSLQYSAAQATTKEAKTANPEKIKLNLWPSTMWDFLERRLLTHFAVSAYTLDPAKLVKPVKGVAECQQLSPLALPMQSDPFKGLVKIDIINAQRGFSDSNTNVGETTGQSGNLSVQLRDYYTNHLDPYDQPVQGDIDALQAMEDATASFSEKLSKSFEPSIRELEDLNYPGFGNPTIKIASQINAMDGLKHSSSVQFDLLKADGAIADFPLSLPEKYNGLGYQNLISMVFKLIRFRDEWMQVGKKMKPVVANEEPEEFEPLHLVLIEEPEAHLHAQVQQVFIRKAYEVLRNNPLLKDLKDFSTQLVVSTHSNHIAHEIDFTCLRYFKRRSAEKGQVPTSIVVNLSTTFGSADDTTKFAIRYLRTTHADLFFADAVILVEGPVERMLVPHFIQSHYPELRSSYLSLLEIGGSHAQKLRPLIEDLGLITLIITDIDAVKLVNSRWNSTNPERGKGYKTGNNVLKTWIPQKVMLDDLLDLKEDDKKSKDFPIKVSYQYPIKVTIDAKEQEAIPYTFEDALVFTNLDFFSGYAGEGIIKDFKEAVTANKTALSMGKALIEVIDKTKKAEFALELLYIEEPKNLLVPKYISKGLDWLKTELDLQQADTILATQPPAPTTTV